MCLASRLPGGFDLRASEVGSDCALYGRQEIRVPNRGHLASLQQIGYVIKIGVL